MVANNLYNTKTETRRLPDQELEVLANVLHSVNQRRLSDEAAIESALEEARLAIEAMIAPVL